MRILLLAWLASCGSAAAFKPEPLPPLIAAPQAAHVIAPHELMLVPGEHLRFAVRMHGIDVGTVELEVGETEVTSRFVTDSLAGALMSVHHDLTTLLDRRTARMTSASENIAIGDDVKHFEMDGKNGQSVHAALGILRSWVAADATPGLLAVQELGHQYRLSVKRPLVEELEGTKTFHVTAVANTKAATTIEIWFAVTPDHLPLRFELVTADYHVTANLIPT
jgi:hypothetical protein